MGIAFTESFPLFSKTFDIDPSTGRVSATINSTIAGKQVTDLDESFRFNLDHLESYKGKLSSQKDKYQNERQILSIKLQDVMSKRGNSIQLISNLMRAASDTAKAITQNCRA